MVSDPEPEDAQGMRELVLILVLMEYGLWQLGTTTVSLLPPVLILVLMEYGLWPRGWRSDPKFHWTS